MNTNIIKVPTNPNDPFSKHQFFVCIAHRLYTKYQFNSPTDRTGQQRRRRQRRRTNEIFFCNFSPTVSKRETGHSRIRKVHANYFCNRACVLPTFLFLSFPVRRNVERNDAYICIYSVTQNGDPWPRPRTGTSIRILSTVENKIH